MSAAEGGGGARKKPEPVVGDNNHKPPVLKLTSGLTATSKSKLLLPNKQKGPNSGTRANPDQGPSSWATLKTLIEKHVYSRQPSRWDPLSYEGRIDAQFGSSSVTFQVEVVNLFTGDLQDVRFVTRVVDTEIQDPIGCLENGLDIWLKRGRSAEFEAHLESVSKKPSHGLRSGKDALGMAIALCRSVGCKSIKLSDGSHLHCAGSNGNMDDARDNSIPLRKARILSRGTGWYESRGFRSLVELVDPGLYERMVSRLHRISVPTLAACLRQQDGLLRAALVDPGAMARMGIVKYTKTDMSEVVVPSIDDLLSMMSRVSVAHEILIRHSESRKKIKEKITSETLGELVDHLIKANCTMAAKFVKALLPDSRDFVVLKHDADGRPVSPIPHEEAWVYTWRLTNTYTDLVLTL